MRRLAHSSVGSTNAEALALARSGERGPLWITAERQTAGRGRRGNAWVSEPGNLYATLLLSNPAAPERRAELSFVAALGVMDAIVGPYSRDVALKWPNDVLLGGRKVAGILLEGEGDFVAIGIGVNCAHHPDHAAFPATHLREFNPQADVENVFALLSAAMQARLQQWDRGAAFSRIRADWLAHAYGLGGDIHVRLTDRELTGRFDGIDAHGRLLLTRRSGIEAITAGEVFGFAESVVA